MYTQTEHAQVIRLPRDGTESKIIYNNLKHSSLILTHTCRRSKMLKLIHLSTSVQVWTWKTWTLNDELNGDCYVQVFSRCQHHIWPYKCLEIAAGGNGVQHFKTVFFIMVIFFYAKYAQFSYWASQTKGFQPKYTHRFFLSPAHFHSSDSCASLEPGWTSVNFPVSVNVPRAGSPLLKRKTRTR